MTKVQKHTVQLNTIEFIDQHAGDPSFRDLPTCTQKPCADSSTVGCNGAVSSSQKHPLSIFLPFSLPIPPPQIKTGPHRGCRHLIGWDITGARERERERENSEQGRKLKEMQLLCPSILTDHWAKGCQKCRHMLCLFSLSDRFVDGKHSGLTG